MAIIGLLLLAAASAIGVETVLSTRASDVAFTIWGESFTAPLAVVFLLGSLLMAFALLGLFMITGRLHHRRAGKATARHRMDSDVTDSLIAENEQLRAELAAERRQAATLGGVAVPPGAGEVPYGDQVGDAVRVDTVSQTGHYDPYPSEMTARRTEGAEQIDLTEDEKARR